MISQYQLLFQEAPITEDITGQLPEDILYPLNSAQRVIQYTFKNARLIGQQLGFEDLFFIENFQLDSDLPFTIKYELFAQRIFLTFAMHNDIMFSGSEGKMATKKDLSFHFAMEKDGIYEVECVAGTTVLVVISFVPEWLLKVTKDFGKLNQLIQQLLDSDLPYDVLPAGSIDAHIFDFLLKVREFDFNSIFARESFFSTYLIMGFGYHEQQLINSGNIKIYEFKKYIDDNYADPDLSLRQIIAGINLPEHTIRRKFKKSYHVTPYSYCQWVRMVHAKDLIQQKLLPIKEVWQMVGFKDESTFRKAYRKFLPEAKI
ncbi:hypothetical protein A9970_04435 [Sphingobacterium sp. UME9]|nr:hypothetical protein [Sphingobacterium sp. UME9]